MSRKEKFTKKEIIKFLKKTSRKHFKTDIYWKDLGRKFLFQKGKCLYTNMKIQLGINASIDHIIPLKFGGTNDLDNICWCETHINYLKNSKSVSYFKKYLKELRESLKDAPFLY